MDFAEQTGMRVIYIEELYRIGIDAVIAEARRVISDGPVYISFDVDGLDPVYAPGTGTPVPGGLTSYEALALVRSLVGLQVVGCDVVEISPDHDTTGNTALLAATVLAELLASIAKTRAG